MTGQQILDKFDEEEHMERWKDIKDYEVLYKVSNFGRVKSFYNSTGKEKILKPSKDKGCYLQVCLHKDGKAKTFTVHRLVAEAFLPNTLNLPCINHKDENKENNCVDNLEWCDYKYNNNYGTHNKKIAEKMINNEKLSKQVLCVETNVAYPSIIEAERQTGINNGNISSCCNGKRNTAGKFHWQYVD